MWYCSLQGSASDSRLELSDSRLDEMRTSPCAYPQHRAAFSVNSSEPPNKPCPYATSVICFTTAMRKNCGGLDIPKRLGHWDTWSRAGGAIWRSLGGAEHILGGRLLKAQSLALLPVCSLLHVHSKRCSPSAPRSCPEPATCCHASWPWRKLFSREPPAQLPRSWRLITAAEKQLTRERI